MFVEWINEQNRQVSWKKSWVLILREKKAGVIHFCSHSLIFFSSIFITGFICSLTLEKKTYQIGWKIHFSTSREFWDLVKKKKAFNEMKRIFIGIIMTETPDLIRLDTLNLKWGLTLLGEMQPLMMSPSILTKYLSTHWLQSPGGKSRTLWMHGARICAATWPDVLFGEFYVPSAWKQGCRISCI